MLQILCFCPPLSDSIPPPPPVPLNVSLDFSPQIHLLVLTMLHEADNDITSSQVSMSTHSIRKTKFLFILLSSTYHPFRPLFHGFLDCDPGVLGI